MLLNKERFLSYLFSLFLLTIFINTIPIPQLPKYIIFILINFFFFICPNNKFFYKDKKFLFRLIIFILIIIITNIPPFKFSIKVNSFGNTEINSNSLKAQEFYKSNFPECYNNANNCYWIDGERPLDAKPGDASLQNNNNINKKVKNIFHRHYLNISNLNELRSNLFSSPGSTMDDAKYKYINKTNYPFFLHFKFPKIYKGSKFCTSNSNTSEICKYITESNRDFEFINKGEKNKLYLKQNLILISIKSFLSILLISSFYFVSKKIYVFKVREKIELLYPLSTILWLTIIGFTNIENINFLNSYLYQYPGGDGFLYLYWGNLISEAFKELNFLEFLRGGVEVFYWMPGMRYFVGIEKIIYGNAYYLHLIILSFLPFIIRKLLSIYLPKRIVFLLIVSFLLFPLMHHMGFSYFQFYRYFTKVFAEPIAYTIFLIGFVRLIYYFDNKNLMHNTLPLTCLILVITCIMRPNLTISCFFLLLIPFFDLIKSRQFKTLTIFCLAGSVIFFPLLHNYYFGGSLVLFTTSLPFNFSAAALSDANVKITLEDYFSLLTTFNIEYEKKRMLFEMLKNFINPFEIHKYFILCGLILSLRSKFLKNRILTPLYILVFTQLVLFFFINPGPRYMWMFWISSLILSVFIFINLKKKLDGKKN
jgi:hypothetical protein